MRCCHPSGRYEDCFKPKALPVPWGSTLQLCRSASGIFWVLSTVRRLIVVHCKWMQQRHREAQISRTLGPYLLGLNTPLHLLWRATATSVLDGSGWLGISPSANTKTFFAPSASWNLLDWISSLAICHVESEAAWNKDPHKVENWHCIFACHVRQANQFLEASEWKVEISNAKVILKHRFSGKHLGPAQFEQNPGFGRPPSYSWLFQTCWLEGWCLNWQAGR